MVGDIFLYIAIGYASIAVGFSIWYYARKKPDQ